MHLSRLIIQQIFTKGVLYVKSLWRAPGYPATTIHPSTHPSIYSSSQPPHTQSLLSACRTPGSACLRQHLAHCLVFLFGLLTLLMAGNSRIYLSFCHWLNFDPEKNEISAFWALASWTVNKCGFETSDQPALQRPWEHPMRWSKNKCAFYNRNFQTHGRDSQPANAKNKNKSLNKQNKQKP